MDKVSKNGISFAEQIQGLMRKLFMGRENRKSL